MPLLDASVRRHWAALAALGAIVLVTAAFARSESGATSVAATAPADGQVRQAAFAVGSDGTSYAAWTRDGGAAPRLEVATGRGARLGAPIPIDVPEGVFDPRIAAGRDSALVAFRAGGQEGTHVMVLRLSRDGAVDGPTRGSATPTNGQFLDVAVADDGAGAVAWTDSQPRYDESGVSSGIRNVLRAATFGPQTLPGPEQLVTEDAGDGFSSLAVAPDGRTALAWAPAGAEVATGVRTGGTLAVVEAQPGGGFGDPAALPGASGDRALGEAAAVAYTEDGALRAAWVEQVGSGMTAGYTGVTAVRSGAFFDHRLELVHNPLAYRPSVVPLTGGELVGFDRAGPGGYLPEQRAWLDVVAVAGGSPLARQALESRGTNSDGNPVAPRLEPVPSGALAVWGSADRIAYAPCSLHDLCDEPRDVVAAGRGERLEPAGIGAGAIAWLASREPLELDFRVGRLEGAK
jgi:hypothetical protein